MVRRCVHPCGNPVRERLEAVCKLNRVNTITSAQQGLRHYLWCVYTTCSAAGDEMINWHREGTAVLRHIARGTGPVSPWECAALPTPCGSKRPSPSPNLR